MITIEKAGEKEKLPGNIFTEILCLLVDKILMPLICHVLSKTCTFSIKPFLIL